MAKEVMKINDLSFVERAAELVMSYGRKDKDISFSPYGDHWKQMRKVCTLELLSSKRVQSFSFIREHEVYKLIESIQNSCTSSGSGSSLINLSKKIFPMTSTITSRAIFGREFENQEKFITLTRKIVDISKGFDLSDLFPSMKFLKSISSTKAKLVKHSGSLETPFTTENIIALIWEMYGGGTDLSSIAVEWTMSELMRNPRVMEKAQAEIREAFKGKKRGKEIDLQKLRYLKESCKIDGYDIPIKTKVIVNAWAIGRDPVYWDKAESFIPERFDSIPFDFKVASFEYLPFGAGRRMCPGILYGLANIELPLAQLLYHFNWELPNGMEPEDLDMTETISATVGRKNNLHLIATSYN
ncbi:Cytochrome P450 [Quillaja saponaria]|uniref:Cytochrome P450 n=1 Tax=Quillaja saponaria TaxID=32244 RepID=A0AAD7QJT7_QUISA|nr:Cytochrome P450 [Quillaja saponaria]